MKRRDLLAAPALALQAASPGSAAEQTKLRAVVVGGHPDDPETGCGGTMARYASLGHSVAALYLTRGEAGIRGTSHEEAARIRTREAEAACDILGAEAIFAGQVDGATEITPALYRQFRETLLAQKPDIVFTHWPIDSHRDHRAASMLVLDAWRAAETKFALYFFEVMTGSQTQNFAPTDYVDISSTEQRKRRACYAHASQHPDSFWPHHDAMDRFRGMECGVRVAEAFVRYVGGPAESFAAVGR